MSVSASEAREQFAAKLRTVRQRSGLTLRELQEATFASDSALSRYLSGKSVPPWNVVVVLCELGHVDAERLRVPWQVARASRRSRRSPADSAGAVQDLQTAAASHLSLLIDGISTHIDAVRARGGQVPERVLELHRHGAAAIGELLAAQKLTESLLRQ